MTDEKLIQINKKSNFIRKVNTVLEDLITRDAIMKKDLLFMQSMIGFFKKLKKDVFLLNIEIIIAR